MATKFYLRSLTAPTLPTSGEKSSAYPTAGAGARVTYASGKDDFLLSLAVGSSQTSSALSSVASTSRQDLYFGRWSSVPLVGQDITAQTWTFGLAMEESSASANTFTMISLYVYRPSSTSVVGYILEIGDSPGVGGEFNSAGEEGKVFTGSGGLVTADAGDLLCLEVWAKATQSLASSYTNTLYFDGATDPTNGVAASNAASYISTPQDLLFFPPPRGKRAPFIQPVNVHRRLM